MATCYKGGILPLWDFSGARWKKGELGRRGKGDAREREEERISTVGSIGTGRGILDALEGRIELFKTPISIIKIQMDRERGGEGARREEE